MKPRQYITDPELLEQLEGNNNSREYVTDPNILKQLNKPEKIPYGASEDFKNNPHRPSIEGMFPQINPNWTQGAGTALMAANPIVAAGRGAAPYAANALARIGTGTAGGTAFDVGDEKNKLNPMQSAKQNALFNTFLETSSPVIKSTIKGAKGAINAFKPQSHAENLVNNLGSGQDLESVGKSAAKAVKESFDKIKEGFNKRYDAIFEHSPVSNSLVYGQISPLQGIQRYGKLDELNLSKDTFHDPDLKNLYQSFINKPTLKASHQFQKELGAEIGSLTRNKKNLDDTQKIRLKTYKKVRDAVNEDAYSFLKKEAPHLANEFKQLSQDYKTHYLPYTSKTAINEIANGVNSNPKLEPFVNVFRNPNEKMQTILSHLPPEFKNKIAHLGLGQSLANVTPKAINEAVSSFEKRGLQSYLSPDIKNELVKMGRKQYAKHGLEGMIGGLLGYNLGNLVGLPNVGAGIGAVGAPFASSKIGPIYRGGKASKNKLLLEDIVESGYRPIARAYEKSRSKKEKENK